MSKQHLLATTRLAMTIAILSLGAGQAWAVTHMPNPGGTPDYYTTPNWANSPPLRKFVDTLPLLNEAGKNNLGQYIPVAIPDTTTYPGADYYEIELGRYSEQMHSDLPPTTLQGYRQTNTSDLTVSQFHYLGPLIVATKDRPVRVKFTNKLGTGANGNLFVPVNTTIMGSGNYDINYNPDTLEPRATNIKGKFKQNRATLHLHGGRTPWISDGTPHQWITPAGETTTYPKGVSVSYVPDMWFDAAGNTIPGCAGQTTCKEKGARNNPGPGSQTFYWTNEQSSRLMFYHDHAWGITRLNVYVGEAAGYLLTDDTEKALLQAGLIPTDQIPLIIQDKTFVDEATITATDPTWNWGTQPGSAVTGDLWWPHVYMPAQNPYNPDMSGVNPMGRWHYGPWFWPPTPVCGSTVDAVYPFCIEKGPVKNPLYDKNCDPLTAVNGFCQPPYNPGTPNPSWGAEAFLDTPMVNGTAYPAITVDPKSYRLRILNAAHDRFLNLQLYRADGTQVNANCPTCATNTEVKMVPAIPRTACSATLSNNCTCTAEFSPAGCFPETWPTDGREGGVPNPATAGPDWIQIGTEGGFLPQPVVLPNQPVVWNMDPTMFNVGNVSGGTLILGPAERADVIIDFSKYAGKTLILYNDAPTAFPALDPHYDYYTNDPDRRDIGGAPSTPVGLGPNVRTIMQITVAPKAPAPAFDLPALQAAFTSTPGAPGVFEQGQSPVVVGQSAYDSTYVNTSNSTKFPSTWPNWGVSRISDTTISFLQPDGTLVKDFPMQPKAIHDEMGGTFDDFGRMSAKLGLELPGANASVANFVLQNYVDPATEFAKNNEPQIWKITHNGVDTHPIHFHLFEVQVLNRVGWDGFIRLPDANELGWKDTVRIAPLEDTIVALRPAIPTVPFRLPDSIRPLDPSQPLGSTMGFTNLDKTGEFFTPPISNELYNFGAEYVWHCHILSHEENDMMRPIVGVVIDPPINVMASPAKPGDPSQGIQVSWTDNSTNETGFTVARALDPGFTRGVTTFTLPASTPNSLTGGAMNLVDTGVTPGTLYYYRVQGMNDYGSATRPNVLGGEWSTAVSAKGTQSMPVLTVSPTPLDFGNVLTKTTSPAQRVTVSNVGSQPMTINSISIAGLNRLQFAQTNTCGPTLAANASCTIDVTFTPTGTVLGVKNATLRVNVAAPAKSQGIPLSGTNAQPQAAIAPTTLTFPTRAVNTLSNPQTVTLSNTGGVPLTVSGISMAGANPTDFNATSCGPTLDPAATCKIKVTFIPGGVGPRAAVLVVNVGAPAQNQTVTLSGAGR